MTGRKEKHKQNTSENRHRGVWGFILGGKRQWVILVLAAIVLMVLVLLGSLRTPGSVGANKRLSTFTVRRDDLTITVTESGSIKARNSIDIKCEVEAGTGGVTIISIVPEGSYITEEDVNNGKVLVELDSSDLREQLELRKIDFAGAEASYAEATEAYDIQIKQNESDITAAELKVKFGLMDLKKYLGEAVAQRVVAKANPEPNSSVDIASLLDESNLGGSASQKLRELNGDITLAEANLEDAAITLHWTEQLYERKYASESDLRRDKLQKQRLEINKQKAKIALKLFELYDFSKDAETFLSDYNEAKRELERTHARARSKEAQTLAMLKKAKAEFRLRSGRLEKVEQQIAACTIIAPAPGLVVYSSSGDPWRRREPIEEGGTVRERQTIITLPNMVEMLAEINVHESSVDKVRPGQTATITIDAFPDKTFRGEVLKVAPLPDPQRGWLSPDLKVYTTQVTIEGTYDFLKPGMSAKVEILIEQLNDVVIVPVQVVANREGKKVCYVAAPQGPKQREVQTGAFNDIFVQITNGLEVGQEVMLNPPRLTEPGTAARFKQQRRPPRDRGEPQERIPREDRKSPEGEKPPHDRQLELTDEVIGRIMGRLAEADPEKARELERLRQTDQEKFKAELGKAMRDIMRQGRSGMEE